MKTILAIAAFFAITLAVSCGDDGGEGVETQLPENTFAIIDGTENGQVKYPVLELWDIPVCKCEKLVTNTPQGTRVRVLAKKATCRPLQYEVEILEGEKAGTRGWVQEKFIRFEDGSPPAD